VGSSVTAASGPIAGSPVPGEAAVAGVSVSDGPVLRLVSATGSDVFAGMVTDARPGMSPTTRPGDGWLGSGGDRLPRTGGGLLALAMLLLAAGALLRVAARRAS
jgi:hypothetical protein